MKLRTLFKSPVLKGATHRLLFFSNVGMFIFLTGYTFFLIRPQASAIPLRYSTIQGFLELNQWYHIWSFVVFAFIITVTNTIVAHTLVVRSGGPEQPTYPWVSRLLFFNLLLLFMTMFIIRSIVQTIS